MRSFAILSLASAVSAALSGFNYGSSNSDGSARTEQDFESLFKRAQSLQGTSGFTSARLYTMIQSGTANTVISAIPAAMASKTTLLLGLWASQDQAGFNNELTALKNAISQYGSDFTSLISGISVGSEDLYRETPTGIANKAGVGASPDQLVSYIKQVRDIIANTPASGAEVGHVDTWTAWVNGSNVAVIDNCDFLGVDGYPYFQTVNANGIENGESLFFQSYNATVNVAQGKKVWVTETGWPVSGPQSGQAVASTANAETYWKDVACKLLGNVNTYWYTLYDPETSGPSFSLVGPNLDSAPLYDLSCSGISSSSSSSSASSSAAKSTMSAAPSVNGVQNGANGGVKQSTTSINTGLGESPLNSDTPQPGSNGGVIHSSEGPDGVMTMYSTTLVTVSACGAQETGKPPVSQPTQPTTPAQSGSGSSGSGSSSSTGSSSGACPATLGSAYQYPHLIVPVDSANPNKAYGTSYNATLSSSRSTVFNYDIPSSYAGKTCSLYFFFPQQKDLETTAFTFNGKGGIDVSSLNTVATQSTSYSNVGASKPVKSISSVAPGNSYLIASGPCKEGAYSYEFSATGGLELNYFQDYNPSALGAFITSC